MPHGSRQFPNGSAMTTFSRFEELDDPDFFVMVVTEHFANSWGEVTGAVKVTPVVSGDRVALAYDIYQSELKEIRLLVPSRKPDHYKRAACLLHALVRAQVVEDVDYDTAYVEELESGMMMGVTYAHAQSELKLFEFLGNNGNEAMAFDFAFRCCQVYETSTKEYGENFFQTMVRHLCAYDGRDVHGLHLIFKAFWGAA
jgi:hypothetical protein